MALAVLAIAAACMVVALAGCGGDDNCAGPSENCSAQYIRDHGLTGCCEGSTTRTCCRMIIPTAFERAADCYVDVRSASGAQRYGSRVCSCGATPGDDTGKEG